MMGDFLSAPSAVECDDGSCSNRSYLMAILLCEV